MLPQHGLLANPDKLSKRKIPVIVGEALVANYPYTFNALVLAESTPFRALSRFNVSGLGAFYDPASASFDESFFSIYGGGFFCPFPNCDNVFGTNIHHFLEDVVKHVYDCHIETKF